MNSLRRRLLLWLLPATFLAGVLASLGTYWGATFVLSDLLNDQMRYIAEIVSVSGGGQVTLADSAKQKRHVEDDQADEVLLQVWDKQGRLTYTTNPSLQLPPPHQTGLRDVNMGNQTWHTFVSQRGD